MTYATLKTDIADQLNRTDLSDTTLSRWISHAEAEMSRRLMKDGPVAQMMGRSDATITTEFTALPTDLLGQRSLFLTGSLNPLEFVEPEEINRRKTLYPNESGDPQVWARVGSEYRVWPWASGGSYAGELTYWKAIVPLSNSNTSNWLLESHPDAYFYASLMHAPLYLKDPAMLSTYATFVTQILADIVGADKLARTAPHLSVGVVAGGTP